MPSNKVSLYDGIINIENSGSCDLSGMVCLVNNGSNIAMGATTIAFDNYVADSGNLFVGQNLYVTHSGKDSTAGDRTGDGDYIYLGTVKSFTGAGSTSGTITLEEGARLAVLNNEKLCNLPKYEIVAIQITKSGALSNLHPSLNHFPGTHLSDGITTWNGNWSETFYGTPADAGGTSYSAAGNLDTGVIIEGRWKHVTIDSSDTAFCYIKATPSRTPNKDKYPIYGLSLA